MSTSVHHTQDTLHSSHSTRERSAECRVQRERQTEREKTDRHTDTSFRATALTTRSGSRQRSIRTRGQDSVGAVGARRVSRALSQECRIAQQISAGCPRACKGSPPAAAAASTACSPATRRSYPEPSLVPECRDAFAARLWACRSSNQRSGACRSGVRSYCIAARSSSTAVACSLDTYAPSDCAQAVPRTHCTACRAFLCLLRASPLHTWPAPPVTTRRPASSRLMTRIPMTTLD